MARELKVGVAIEARDGFSAEARKVADSSGRLSERLKAGQRQLAELGQRQDALKRMEALGKRLSKTSADMDRAARKTAGLRREIQATRDPSRKLATSFDAARKTSSALRREHASQRDELRALRGELREAGIDTEDLAAAQRRAADSMENASRRIGDVNAAARRRVDAEEAFARRSEAQSRIVLAAQGAAQAGSRLRELGFAPARRARPLEESKGLLVQLGLSREEVDVIAGRGRALSRQIPGVTTSGFTDLAYPLKSGISSLTPAGVADIAEISAITARASAAAPMDVADAMARGFATFKRPLAPDMDDREFAAQYGAGLTAAAQKFRTTGTEMARAVENAGSGLSLLGVSLAEQLALHGELQGTMDGSQVGTATRAFFAKLAVAQEGFAEMGRPVRLLDESDKALPLADMVENITAAYGGRWSAVAEAEVSKAFGSEEAVRLVKDLWGNASGFRESESFIAGAMGDPERYIRAIQQARDDNPHAALQVSEQGLAATMEEIGERQLELMRRPLEIANLMLGRFERLVGEEAAAWTATAAGATGGALEVGANAAMAVGGTLVARDYLKRWRARSAERRLAGNLPGAPRASSAERVLERSRSLREGSLARRGMETLSRGLAKAAPALSRIPAPLKKVPWVGPALAGVTAAGTLASDLPAREKTARLGENLGAIGGGSGGAAIGALIGTAVLPVAGTLVGGLIGSIVGGFAGDALGGKIGEKIAEALPPEAGEARAAADRSQPNPTRAELTVHNHNNAPVAQIVVQQREGEDLQDLVDRIIDALRERQEELRRGSFADAY